MPFFSNKEIKTRPAGYAPAKVLDGGSVQQAAPSGEGE